MESKPVPKYDYPKFPTEDLSDFVPLPWYQTLLNDPTFTPIDNRTNRSNIANKRRRDFFTQTLWTDSTVRASQAFYRGFLVPERWSGEPRPVEAQQGPGECRMICSLGEGLSGGTNGTAHGGLIATLLDEVLGLLVVSQWGAGCVTGELTVRYERLCPIPGVVLCRSWIEKTEGRKVWIKGVVEDGKGLVFASSQCLYFKAKEKL